MALDPSNSSNLVQLPLKELKSVIVLFAAHLITSNNFLTHYANPILLIRNFHMSFSRNHQLCHINHHHSHPYRHPLPIPFHSILKLIFPTNPFRRRKLVPTGLPFTDSRYCHECVCPSVCLSGTGVHCDHKVHFSADLSLWTAEKWKHYKNNSTHIFCPQFQIASSAIVRYLDRQDRNKLKRCFV